MQCYCVLLDCVHVHMVLHHCCIMDLMNRDGGLHSLLWPENQEALSDLLLKANNIFWSFQLSAEDAKKYHTVKEREFENYFRNFIFKRDKIKNCRQKLGERWILHHSSVQRIATTQTYTMKWSVIWSWSGYKHWTFTSRPIPDPG